MAEKEYIEREATIEKLNKLCDRVCQYSKAQRKVMCGACPLGDAFTVIEDDIPAADVRPVVRCRDCKYCSPELTREERSIPDADLVCAYWDSDGLDANDFCSRGERKGGDERWARLHYN